MRLAVLALALASAAFAAAPDFSGNWKLNGSKSDFGQFPAPSSLTVKITHNEPKLAAEVKMSGDNGDLELTSNYTTDGKECTNPGFGGGEMKTTANWDGETLVLDNKGSFGDNAFTMKDRWSLSDGGKTLTILRHFSSAMGEADQKLIFEKQ